MPEEKNVTSPNPASADNTAAGKSTGTNVPVSSNGANDGSDLNDRYMKSQEQINKLENDIRNLKSTYDRKAFEEKQSWQQKETEYQKQLRDLQYKLTPEDQRPTFERKILDEDLEAIKRERDQYKSMIEQQEQIKNYVKFFGEAGIDVSKLDQSSPEAVVNTGWEEMAKEMKRLKEAQNNSIPAAPPPEQQPPDVHISNTSSSNIKPTWADLEKQYGSRERVYRLVELQQLPPSILPD